MAERLTWNAFRDGVVRVPELDVTLDLSTMPISAEAEQGLAPEFDRAFAEMAQLEGGAVANPDEGRRVGHYWLRNPELAPEAELGEQIRRTVERVKDLGRDVLSGRLGNPRGEPFRDVLHVGIGGSALGPQLMAEALAGPGDRPSIHFLDNTDPDGFRQMLERLGNELRQTLVVVVSKSGGTPETRNGLEEIRARMSELAMEPARHLVAVTGEGSKLDQMARQQGWVDVFPMWDWVGGRTSETSAVGLLPLALQGHDVDAFLEGARRMDEATRVADLAQNPAARLALAWHAATAGRGRRDMVVIPYRDRLALFSRYLQQLVMESLGKREDLEGNVVEQGISVYGNKGSTDQHAYVQQLRDGVDNFFATLIGVLEDREPAAGTDVDGQGGTSADYLQGFLLGTRRALVERGRGVITLTLPRIDERQMGGLIALFERAVGLYASLVRINAYHQPGVEAGKKAAGDVLTLKRELLKTMSQEPDAARTAREWADMVGSGHLAVEALWLLERLSREPAAGVRRRQGEPASPEALYGAEGA
jgi:glucose-6-phosphate isomerase